MSKAIHYLDKILNEGTGFAQPSVKDYDGIVEKMQNELGVKGIPEWFRFLTFQEGTSNKFHYFAIFKWGRGFIAANASGKIGTDSPQVHVIATGSFDEVEKKALSKYRAKSSKGYTDITDSLKK